MYRLGYCISCFETGTEAPHQISCLAMDGNAVWASSGPLVIKYLRGKEVSPCLTFISADITTFLPGRTHDKSAGNEPVLYHSVWISTPCTLGGWYPFIRVGHG
jgi:hypothetical protein